MIICFKINHQYKKAEVVQYLDVSSLEGLVDLTERYGELLITPIKDKHAKLNVSVKENVKAEA
jgi:hypothetical protein